MRSFIGKGRRPSRYNTAKHRPADGSRDRATPREDSIKALTLTIARVAATLAVALLVAFLVAVLVLRHVVFPRIDDYRDDIAASVSRASGMQVTLEDVDAGWAGLRPRLQLAGVNVRDRQGRAVFSLVRAEITLSWWTLLAGDLRFNDVDFFSPELRLHRGKDGLVYLADKPLNAASTSEDGAFTAWLLAQPRLGIHDATLFWRDDFAGAPEIELRQVEIAVRKAGRRHRAALQAQPPPEIAGRIDLRADVALQWQGEAWQAAGTLYAETGHADLARLRTHLPVPETLRSATGRFRAWIDVEPGAVREVTADMDLRGVRARFEDDARPLELESLSGRAFYRAQEGGFAVGTRGLAFRSAGGLASDAGDFSVSIRRESGGSRRGEIRVHGVDLKIAAAMLDYLPVPKESKALAARFAPRGQLLESSLVWTGETPATASAFRVRGQFEGLGVNAADGFPGASGITGTLDGDERGGRLRLAARDVTFEAPRIFRQALALDTVEAKATWSRAEGGLEVRIEEARLANRDAEIVAAGTWRAPEKGNERSPGTVDLAGRIVRAQAPAVAAYLPNAIAVTRSWLERAVQAGRLANGRFELRGDLWHFPFRDPARGKFLAEAGIEGGRLVYDPAWPAVDGIRGTIRFENVRMDIDAREAVIYASHARFARATIADLAANPPQLEIEGDMDTTGGDGVRFLRETPLAAGPGAFTRVVAVEGPARLKLRIGYPLWGKDPVRVAGDYAFDGATASVGRHLVMGGIHGNLAFTERSVRATELQGAMFGRPAVLRLGSQPDGSVLTELDGQLDAAALATFLPGPFARRIAGAADWKARAVTGSGGTELRVTSSLRGLAIGLPEPFAKMAGDERPLTVAIRRLGEDDEEIVARMDGGVHARINRGAGGGDGPWNAALRFGSPLTTEPVREGLWLYGELDRFDLDAWRTALATPGAAAEIADGLPALELRGFDVRLRRLRYTGRDFAQLGANLRRDGGDWRGTLSGPAIDGEVTFNTAGRGRFAARLARLTLGEARQGAAGPEPAGPAQSEPLPELDVVAERLELHGRWLGKLTLKARPEGDDWRIERLDLENAHARLASSGVARHAATGPITRLDVQLSTTNLSALLGQFGFGNQVNRGEGRLQGNLVWPGLPTDFSPSQLSGSLKVEASKGQFARIEPGAGKLLGLLSLQSIPRRITLDFRDIFSEGFAFDRMAGEVRIARGVLVTRDFEIAGPSAFVSMAGEVSLPLETQSLTIRVVPEVGEGVAIAATLLGTPVMGLTTLLLQKLLQNPLGKAVSYEYLVTGSWDNPSVTRVGTAPAASPPAPPGPRP